MFHGDIFSNFGLLLPHISHVMTQLPLEKIAYRCLYGIIIPVGVLAFLFYSHIVLGFISDQRTIMELLESNKETLSLIFSSVAFLGVLGTIIYQINTYKSTKKTNALQRFETTFFNMLGLQQQITTELKSPDKEIEEQGRALFEYLYKDYSTQDGEVNFPYVDYNGTNYGNDCLISILWRDGLNEYRKSNLPSVFDHYFRHLYRIIKFIDNPKHDFLTFDERYAYAGNLRGTLSKYELVWLYYNCLAGPGFEKFKPLVEKYALLKNIREEFLGISNEFRFYAGTTTPRSIEDFGEYNDYQFYLTDDERQKDKYYRGAFYSKKELEIKKRKFQEERAEFNDWKEHLPNQPAPEPERVPGQE